MQNIFVEDYKYNSFTMENYEETGSLILIVSELA